MLPLRLLHIKYRHQVPLLQQYSSCWATLLQLITKPPPVTSTWIHHQLQFPLWAAHLESETPTRMSPEAYPVFFFVSTQTKLWSFTRCQHDFLLKEQLLILIIMIIIIIIIIIMVLPLSWWFPNPIVVRVTQTILLRGRKCISFAKCGVRSVVILSEERWVLKCLFEPCGLIKK